MEFRWLPRGNIPRFDEPAIMTTLLKEVTGWKPMLRVQRFPEIKKMLLDLCIRNLYSRGQAPLHSKWERRVWEQRCRFFPLFFFSSASNNVTCTFFCSRRCDAVETRSGKRKCETGCGNEERNWEAVELLCRPLPQDLLSSPPSLFPYVQSALEWCD